MGENLESNKVSDLLNQMTNLARDFYKLEVDIFLENDKIVNWIIGLSTGGFVLCISRISKENIPEILYPLICSIIIYILILASTLIEKLYAKGVRKYSGLIDQQFAMVKFHLLINPKPIEQDFDKLQITSLTAKYLKGEYFTGKFKNDFETTKQAYEISHKAAGIAFLFIIGLFLLQYLMLVILIFKSL